LRRLVSKLSTRTLSVIAGLLHGLAGPGGVLGVIPAVQLHDAKLATIYLASFCIMSILTMGGFATAYAMISHRLAKGGNAGRALLIESASASISIVVGILWIILLATGKMDDIFH
jgi:hypothetical protein